MPKPKSSTAPARTSLATTPIGPLAKDVLRLAYHARRSVLLEGETGIGKSELVAQVATDLKINFHVLDLSLLEPPDLVGLPILTNNETTFAPPKSLPKSGAGILMLEELNRAERFIQQPALQLLTARRLHEYQLPEGWAVFAAINPEEGDYQVTPLDPALRSRFLNLRVHAERAEWLLWAKANDVHPAIVGLAESHERFLETTPPRTWKYVSDFLKCFASGQFQRGVLHTALQGYLPDAWALLVMDALKEGAAPAGMDVKELLRVYHERADLQQRVQALGTAGQTDRLEQLAHATHRLMDHPDFKRLLSQQQFKLAAFEAFIVDLPGDLREELQHALAEHPEVVAQLSVKPDEFLQGGYAPANRGQVEQWAKSPNLRHRVGVLVRALCLKLEQHPNPLQLKQNGGIPTALGKLAEQLRYTPAALKQLQETVLKLGIQVPWPKPTK